jgi:hypothetical protein
VQADAEHQQNDADLCEFGCERLIRNVAGSEWTHRDAGQQISDQRRGFQAMRNGAEHEGQRQTCDDGGDQRRVVRHAVWASMVWCCATS